MQLQFLIKLLKITILGIFPITPIEILKLLNALHKNLVLAPSFNGLLAKSVLQSS